MDANKKNFFDNIQKSTKGKVSEKDIMNLAGNLKPTDVTNEQSLRQLVLQVSKMAGVKVTDQTVNQIVKSIQQSGLDPNNLEQMMKMMQGK